MTTVTPDSSPETPPLLTEDELQQTRWNVLILTGIGFVLFLAFVYGYARFAGPYIDSLSDRIGENVSARAKNLADAGMNDEAISLFQEALSKQFHDEPQQRIWTMHRYAEALMDEKRLEEVLPLMEEAGKLDPSDGKSYNLWFLSLRGLNRQDEALALTTRYLEQFAKDDAKEFTRIAQYNAGTVYRDKGDFANALTAFQASHVISPGAGTALQCALCLVQLNRGNEAGEYLAVAEASSDPAISTQARDLKARMSGSAPQ